MNEVADSGATAAALQASGGLRSRVMNGLGWKLATQVVLQGSRAIVSVILARLLLPEEFGLAMMAVVVASLALIFSDLAFGAALIQRSELDQRDCSTVFWVSVAVGAVFSVACALGSAVLAQLYSEPRVAPLFLAISPIFFVTAVGTTHMTLLTRNMEFRRLELRTMISTLAGACVGVTAAALGAGAEAIIAQFLVTAAVGTTLLWFSLPWRPSFVVSLTSLRSLGGFSARVFSSRLLFYVSRNADSLLIGRFLGAAALGAYTIAYNIMLVPFAKIAGPIQEVLFPAFARIQDDRGRIGSIWLRTIHVVAAIALPAMLGLVVVAPDFVTVVLGPRWEPAIELIQILAWVGVLQSLVRLNSSVQQACDRTDLLLRWAVLIAASNVFAFAVGLTWGVVGVASAYAITNTLLQPLNMWQTGRIVGVSPWAFVMNLAGVAQATALMIAVILPLRALLVSEGVPAGARLVLVTGAGIAAYAGGCLWRDRRLVREVRSIVARRGRARTAVPAPAA
jgi:O-antigen/teichoic acid export membrane protein